MCVCVCVPVFNSSTMPLPQRPASFHIPGQKGQFVLSIKAHVFLGLPRGDLFKWYPDMKVPTTSEERKTIVKQGEPSTI